MKLEDMILANRSYRRFDSSHAVGESLLRDLVALARITPSAANRQPLKYVLCCSPEWNARIFETLGWAGYLPEWPGPGPAEQPTAYIVVLVDKDIAKSADMDVGIAAQTMLLGAVEKGLGGCMLANVKRDALAQRLELPESLAVALVIAIGKPVEKVVLEDLPTGGSIKYYRDSSQTHHVPKRSVEEMIHKIL